MIKSDDFTLESFNFPVGEKHVTLSSVFFSKGVSLEFIFEKNEDIIELLLVVDAIKRNGGWITRLFIPYVPFSRQDRVNVVGECFSLKVFADLVNGIGAKEVVIEDPHSDVTPALINNVTVRKQWHLLGQYLPETNDYWLVSPDAGALKKTYQMASKVTSLGVVECGKYRDTATGKITGTIVHSEDLQGKDCYIVDDICDGGRTFIEIAKELKKKNAGKIVLMVTHGFFTKGLEVFDGLIDEIYTSKGKVKRWFDLV